MGFSKSVVIPAILIFIASATFAAAPGTNSATPILPKQFAGWQIQGASQASKDAGAADPTNAPLLKEYGFSDFEAATYRSDDGRTLKIRAARFADATGAFGAYSLYLQPEMAREEVGDQAASLNQRVLFYRGHILVDAVFSEVSVMSAASLRELAGELPRPGGNAGNLPPILAFMPHHGYQTNTEKYAEGPLGLGAIASPLPSQLVDFGAGPEVVLGQYSTSSGPATLMLIEYPTPALAAEHLRRIDAANHAAQPQAGVEAVENIGPFFDKRSGPIIAIAFAVLNTVGFVLPAFVLEPLSERIGRVRVHGIACALMAVSYAAIALKVTSPAGLYLCMAVAGVGWASIVSIPFAIMSELVDQRRMGLFMGVFNLSVVLPQLLVSLFVGSVIQHAANKSVTFVISAVALGASASLWMMVRDHSSARRQAAG